MKCRRNHSQRSVLKPRFECEYLRLVWLFLGLCVPLFGNKGAAAQNMAEPHATVQLVSERNALQPEGSMWIGLLFHLDKGWHIYWENPGDSGEPPTVQWALPPGFKVSALHWPAPIRLGAAPIVDYGYEDQVLLMSTLDAPASSQKDSPATVVADVRYIVCREICIPGKAHLTLSVPLAANSAVQFSEWRPLFQKTKAQFPRRLPTGWQISAESRGNEFIISGESPAPVHAAAFFPSQPGVIENAAPQPFASSKHGFRLTLEKSQQLVKPPAILKGVIVLDSGAAYSVSSPISPGGQ
jgi:DsbC/DsbD-like thiol-disulfide interchange protein